MPGLAFPTDPAYQREYSNDRATPLSSAEDIPIDPALAGPVIDPVILAQESALNSVRLHSHQHELVRHQHQLPSTSQYRAQYSPGPQGDPFAPLPPPIYVLESNNISTPRPAKRKRKPRREEECGFCQGDDSKNKHGNPEIMVTCVECGRSGHPTCMDLGDVADVVRSYPWICIECKKCEICREKGDDERILFCDFCDRGWHMDCLQPPLNESPPGKWHCPICPPLDYQFAQSDTPEQDPSRGNPREMSVASTSYSHEVLAASFNKRGGKSNPLFTDESEVDSPVSKKSSRGKKLKGKGLPRMSDTDRDEVPTHGTRSIKRMKLKVTTPPPLRMVVRLRLPPNKGKGKEREEEECSQKDIFGDILMPEDRDTTRTMIEAGDKSRYEKSRAAAEAKLFPPSLPAPTQRLEYPEDTPGPSSRPLRSSHLHAHPIRIPSTPGPPASPAPSTPGPGQPSKALSSSTSTLRIRTIRFGEFDIQTWYDAPFPEEYANLPDGRLWLCEFCLKYMKSQFLSIRHRTKCRMRHPPGDEIYRDGAVSVFEVDGRKNKIYCQNLCLLSKMFLDHKSLFYDVEPFLFYVITETDDIGARFVGYFSKEKRSPKDYNVSCIMTLPVRQRKGWGNLLIDFSYLLSKKEQRVGSPEKPLSALGALGYKNYWTLAVMRYLDTAPDHIRLEDISSATCMTIEDICATLVQQGMLIKRDRTPPTPSVRPSPGQSIKITRGRKNGVARRHLQRKQTNDDDSSKLPFVEPKDYEVAWDRTVVRTYLDKWDVKGYLKLKPERLKWSPFILSRARKSEVSAPPDAVNGGVVEAVEAISVNKQAPNVEVIVHGSPSRRKASSVQSEAAASVPPSSSSESPTKEISQMEKDYALAVKLANTRPSPATRLRSQDSLFNDSHLGQPKTNGNSHSQSARRSRSQSSKASVVSMRPANTLKEDQALAEKLALEDNLSMRQLRSRSNTVVAHETKRTASIVSSRGPTPVKKRRRIESSPEVESPVIHAVELEDNNNSHVVDNTVVQKACADSGLIAVDVDLRVVKPNGVNGQLPSNPLKAVSTASNSIEIPVLEIPVSNQLEDAKHEVAVVSLDDGTPLTALTSRLSEGEDDVVEAAMKGEEHNPDIDAEGEVDEDAEGIADEDAEGDMDAEGEWDEDAEGEPDDGIDYS